MRLDTEAARKTLALAVGIERIQEESWDRIRERGDQEDPWDTCMEGDGDDGGATPPRPVRRG